MAKMALSSNSGSVVYDGHSNFGIGFAFASDLPTISSFTNVGEELVAVAWEYLREFQGHPDLWIEDSEYGDDIASPEEYDPLIASRCFTCDCPPSTKYAMEYLEIPRSGEDHHVYLQRGEHKYEDYHLQWVGDCDQEIVVKCGASDMPEKRWKRLFINSCYSGSHYWHLFNHGSLFFTDSVCCEHETTKSFVEAVIDGKEDSEILHDINSIEHCNQYHRF